MTSLRQKPDQSDFADGFQTQRYPAPAWGIPGKQMNDPHHLYLKNPSYARSMNFLVVYANSNGVTGQMIQDCWPLGTEMTA